ncbi:MAG: hypothetical protein H6Q30_3054 [Bacteroidetes bacterium]|nr:hypothetical protein [Bacteroidota bacterium]
MFWIKLLTSFIKILREGQTPNQVAGGFALGMIVGISPSITLQGLFIWLIILILDVNLSAALLAFTVFALIAFLADPLFHALGYFLLVDVDALHGLWTWMYNVPIAPLTRFYNTVVMGSFASGLILVFPVYFGMKRFVVAYRTTIGARIERTRIYQVLKKNALVTWYTKIRDFTR